MPRKFNSSHYKTFIGCDIGAPSSCLNVIDCMVQELFDFGVLNLRTKFDGQFDDLIDIRKVSSEAFNSSIVGRVVVSADYESCLINSLSSVADQLSWAAHAGMYAVILDLYCFDLNTLAGVVSEFCLKYPAEHSVTRLWISCRVSDWSLWNQVQTVCKYPGKLCVLLVYDPNEFVDSFVMCQWFSEPVSAIEFANNSVPQSSHSVLMEFFKRNCQPIVHLAASARDEIFRLLESAPKLTWDQVYVGGYHDTLQLPLQPLADHMDNGVYETFETDKTKYDLYEEAIYRAIVHLNPTDTLRVAIVGAGRGGLVDSAMRAVSRISNCKCELFAIEKNPNAARTLQYRRLDEPGWADVRIIHCDMRNLRRCDIGGGYFDVLVSELLGSLCDNEASPECINGVIHLLNPTRGICIPQKYFSSVEPVSCPKIWQTARDIGKLETVLVVYFHSSFFPTSAPKLLFEFSHQKKPPNTTALTATVSWECEATYTLHGFAGYFHADLFGGVVMSTHPPSKTPGMVSWFPAYLPLKVPVLVAKGQTVELQVNRKATQAKMFLEWTLLEPLVTETHNANGCSHSVALS